MSDTPLPRADAEAVEAVRLFHNPAYPEMWETETWEPRGPLSDVPGDTGILPPTEYRALPAAQFEALLATIAALRGEVEGARGALVRLKDFFDLGPFLFAESNRFPHACKVVNELCAALGITDADAPREV